MKAIFFQKIYIPTISNVINVLFSIKEKIYIHNIRDKKFYILFYM